MYGEGNFSRPKSDSAGSSSTSPRHRHHHHHYHHNGTNESLSFTGPIIAGDHAKGSSSTSSYQKMTPSTTTTTTTTTSSGSNNNNNVSFLNTISIPHNNNNNNNSSSSSRIRRHISNSTNRQFSPWIRKPLWAVHTQEEHHDHDLSQLFTTTTTTETKSSNPATASKKNDPNGNTTTTTINNNNQLHRHLTLFDLVCVGVGGTIGSGIFVLCGLIAHNYAGPSTFLSWGVAGVAACLSGCCFAELAGRIPTSGSSYAYTFVSMGELPAFLSAGCLTLEYLLSGSAVARSWGDKVVEWFQISDDDDNDDNVNFNNSTSSSSSSSLILSIINPGYGINPMACLVSAISTILLYQGVKESKSVTNLFSTIKVLLVIFMTIGGFMLLDTNNYKPLVPTQYGISGIFRGATSSFFGYIGYDEVCCLAGEVINPKYNMPRAVMLVIVLVSILYMTSALALVGMQPFDEISEASGFPVAFAYNNVQWASTICALGELITLPIVVLITLMAQPRLQYALAEDGLIPSWFGHVDYMGNLRNGTLFAGIIMTIVATFVPFTYLNDLISAGILIAFSMTDCSVILLRLSSPLSSSSAVVSSSSSSFSHGHSNQQENSFLLEKLLFIFNIQCFISSLIMNQYWDNAFGRCLIVIFLISMIGNVCYIKYKCPPRKVFGSDDSCCDNNTSTSSNYFNPTDSSSSSSSSNSDDPTFMALVSKNQSSCRQKQQSTASQNNNNNTSDTTEESSYFQTPFVPYIPCLGIFVNWYLISQLEFTGLLLLLCYLLFWVVLYYCYGAKYSYGNTRGWDIKNINEYNSSSSGAAVGGINDNTQQQPYAYSLVDHHDNSTSTTLEPPIINHSISSTNDNNHNNVLYDNDHGPNEPMLLRTISLPKRGQSATSTNVSTTT